MKRTETKTIGEVLNTALQKVVNQDSLCKNCQLRHENGICFSASLVSQLIIITIKKGDK